jgi:mannose-6-phosphate isomerase-like protein (cupin superfamily)
MTKIVFKPWGTEEIWAHTDSYVGKILNIQHGHRLSLQYHKVKDESVRVLKGTLTLVIGTETRTLKQGEAVRIPPATVHRMEANHGDVQVIEVSTPELEDIVRLHDDYDRNILI